MTPHLAAGTLLLLAAALPTAILGGVVGFGTGLTMLPLVVWAVGVRASVPVLSIALLLGNCSRAWFSRHELDGRVIGAYLAGALPLAVLGSVIYAGARVEWLARLMGLFLLVSVPLRTRPDAHAPRPLPRVLITAFGLLFLVFPPH